VHLRHGSPVLRQRAFFEGQPVEGSKVKDIAWFRADGHELDQDDWYDADPPVLQVFLSGLAIRTRGPRGERVTDASYLIQLNAGDTAVAVTRPGAPYPRGYVLALDTSGTLRGKGAPKAVPAQSVVLLEARA
jgi:glycogen operon protein